ncbi:MAG: hypothetical protein ACI9WU_001924 [Myxococcota bacterium]
MGWLGPVEDRILNGELDGRAGSGKLDGPLGLLGVGLSRGCDSDFTAAAIRRGNASLGHLIGVHFVIAAIGRLFLAAAARGMRFVVDRAVEQRQDPRGPQVGYEGKHGHKADGTTHHPVNLWLEPVRVKVGLPVLRLRGHVSMARAAEGNIRAHSSCGTGCLL